MNFCSLMATIKKSYSDLNSGEMFLNTNNISKREKHMRSIIYIKKKEKPNPMPIASNCT